MNENEKNQKIEKIESVPSVHLLIRSSSGDPIGLLGGESRALALALNEAAQMEDYPVTKREDNVISIGQDTYDTTLAYAMSIRGLFTFENHKHMEELWKRIPSDAKISFFVSY